MVIKPRRKRGELEAQALSILWDHDSWLTPAETGHHLDPDLAYTTVVTVLTRLHKKGLVVRQKHGRAHIYKAASTREEHAAEAMGELLDNARNPETALSYFVDNLDEANRRRLLRSLRNRR